MKTSSKLAKSAAALFAVLMFAAAVPAFADHDDDDRDDRRFDRDDDRNERRFDRDDDRGDRRFDRDDDHGDRRFDRDDDRRGRYENHRHENCRDDDDVERVIRAIHIFRAIVRDY